MRAYHCEHKPTHASMTHSHTPCVFAGAFVSAPFFPTTTAAVSYPTTTGTGTTTFCSSPNALPHCSSSSSSSSSFLSPAVADRVSSRRRCRLPSILKPPSQHSIPQHTSPHHHNYPNLSESDSNGIITLTPTRTTSCTASTAPSDNDGRGDWDVVTAHVRTLCPDLDEGIVDKLVARAFGWGTQKFWRGRMKKQPVSLATVTASLDFLRDTVGLSDEQIAGIVPKLPEVLALPLKRMQENVSYIVKTYPSLKDQRLVNAIVDNPAVLGYDFDCEGDCQSECARCWVQF